MHWSDDFYTDYPFVDWYKTTQHEGHSQYFSKRIGFWTRWLSILILPLHTNLCKRLRVYEWLDQTWLRINFLFLSKKDINCVLKIPVANFYRLITPQAHPGHGRCFTYWNFNCVWFTIQLFLNQSPKLPLSETVYEAFNLVQNYSVCLESS